MSEERTIIDKPGTVITGIITGGVLVVAGGGLTLRGTITGELEVCAGGEAHISGGVVQGLVKNDGGTLWINHRGTVVGQLRSSGFLYIDPGLIGRKRRI